MTDLRNIAKRTTSMEAVRHELFSDMSARVTAFLQEYKIDASVAEHCGQDLADFLATEWGGQHITIPKDYKFELATRNVEIYRKFTGNNYRTLAREFNLTENAIYRIVKTVTERLRADSQPDFFSKGE
jgi:Mor family transcriptional regulator